MKKKVIGLFIVCGGMFWAHQSGAIDRSGSDYRVEFIGTPGAKMVGVYGWADPTAHRPTHMDKVDGVLPKTVSFNPPKGYIVTATGRSLDGGSITVRIFRGGVECGKPISEGTAALPRKVCQP